MPHGDSRTRGAGRGDVLPLCSFKACLASQTPVLLLSRVCSSAKCGPRYGRTSRRLDSPPAPSLGAGAHMEQTASHGADRGSLDGVDANSGNSNCQFAPGVQVGACESRNGLRVVCVPDSHHRLSLEDRERGGRVWAGEGLGPVAGGVGEWVPRAPGRNRLLRVGPCLLF